MWQQVEQDLAKLLSSKQFPALRGVPDYDALLSRTTGLPDAAACKKAAGQIVSSSALRTGIREFGSREPVRSREWSKPLCRAVDLKSNKYGAWWFDEELVQRWGRQYPPGTPNRKQEILESIRPMLAVCMDWNGFTDLRLMRPSSAIPVITGQGAHQPIYSAADVRNAESSNVFFIGGFAQVYVPFVNPTSTSEYIF